MALLDWSDSYSVGVKSIDSQHTNLFNIVNELHTAMMQRQATDVTGSLLNRLFDYARYHFLFEEKLMVATRYPGLAAHRTHHIALTKQVEDFLARFQRGDISINIHLLRFLGDWFTRHIQQDDKEYRHWLNSHGVS
jgi:hemerythrin